MAAILGTAVIMLLMPSKSTDDSSNSVDLGDMEAEPRVLTLDFGPSEDMTEEMIAKENAII